MTQVINDSVETELLIGGTEWLVVEAIVELSKITTPNHVDMIIIPKPDEDEIPPPENIDNLIGSKFEIKADNQLISERTTDAEEDSLLFTGNLANIAPTGKYSYEARAYDPSQQAFEPDSKSSGGSLTNTKINTPSPSYQYDAFLFNKADGVSYKPPTIKADKVVERAADALNITETDISLSENGTKVGEERYGINENLYFDSHEITVKKALEQAREKTKSDWWFDKEGVFNFGVPDPNRHSLQYITDTSAGKTTPPYQSIEVIGSGAVSQGGYSQSSLEIEEKIVKKGNIATIEGEGGYSVIEVESAENLNPPTFTYKNLSISTDRQAQSTLKTLSKKIGDQQAEGKVTVVGFPEIEPFDGIVMPQASDESGENYNPNQPMGGYGYGVYRVTHFLNASDGFVTEIEVSGVTGVTKPVMPQRFDISEEFNVQTGPRGQ